MSININEPCKVNLNNSFDCKDKKVFFAKTKDVPNDSVEFSTSSKKTNWSLIAAGVALLGAIAGAFAIYKGRGTKLVQETEQQLEQAISEKSKKIQQIVQERAQDVVDVTRMQDAQNTVIEVAHGGCGKSAKESAEAIEQAYSERISNEIGQITATPKAKENQVKALDVEVVEYIPAKAKSANKTKKTISSSKQDAIKGVQQPKKEEVIDVEAVSQSSATKKPIEFKEIEGNKVTINASKYQESFEEFMGTKTNTNQASKQVNKKATSSSPINEDEATWYATNTLHNKNNSVAEYLDDDIDDILNLNRPQKTANSYGFFDDSVTTHSDAFGFGINHNNLMDDGFGSNGFAHSGLDYDYNRSGFTTGIDGGSSFSGISDDLSDMI